MATKPRVDPQQLPQLRDEKARGATAKLITENDAFKDIMHRRREKLISAWLHTAPDDVKSREWFYHQALAQLALYKDLETIINTGTMAGIVLNQESK
jgi:hypothetical protein